MRSKRRRGNRPVAAVEVPEKRLRACDRYAEKARAEMRALDARPMLERRLVQYFGERRAGEAMSRVNPEEVARWLRDEAGFARYCGEAEAAVPATPVVDPAAAWAAYMRGD